MKQILDLAIRVRIHILDGFRKRIRNSGWDAFSIPDFPETRIAARMHKLKAERSGGFVPIYVCVSKKFAILERF